MEGLARLVGAQMSHWDKEEGVRGLRGWGDITSILKPLDRTSTATPIARLLPHFCPYLSIFEIYFAPHPFLISFRARSPLDFCYLSQLHDLNTTHVSNAHVPTRKAHPSHTILHDVWVGCAFRACSQYGNRRQVRGRSKRAKNGGHGVGEVRWIGVHRMS